MGTKLPVDEMIEPAQASAFDAGADIVDLHFAP
jgi:hypothetical protein